MAKQPPKGPKGDRVLPKRSAPTASGRQQAVVFPAPSSGLNGQEKRGESGAAGRARRALRPWVGPQWAPRVPWGPGPKRARLQCSLAPTTAQARSLSLLLIATRLAICCCEPAAATRRPSRPPGRPRLESCCRTQHGRRRPAPVLSAPALSACRAGFHRQHRPLRNVAPSLAPPSRCREGCGAMLCVTSSPSWRRL